ncbi:MAG: DUF1800 domain-containing protein [Bacteroidia bacterium]|nr:DUF1800 domain-containing protein [Bacteroidia bacterium]
MASLAPHTGVLGRRLAAHLLRRTTFGATRQEIDSYAALSADQAVDQLMTFPTPPLPPVDPATNLPWVVTGRTNANSPDDDLKLILGGWWLHTVFDPSQPLSAFAKMTFFNHCCFPIGHNVVEYSENFYYSLQLYMIMAGGNYKALARKICLDNGMNDYLDIGESEKNAPNENFVREFFELHTIGKGPSNGPGDYTTFTELDVTEAARLMTGFRRNDDWANPLYQDVETGLPRARPFVNRHDDTDKMFSNSFGNQVIAGENTDLGMFSEVDQFVEMIFAQLATAKTICRKLYRYFVRYKIDQEVEDDIIAPLAQQMIINNYELMPAVKQLLKSQHFYDADDADAGDEVIGALIKSPLDLQCQIVRYFNIAIPDPVLDPFAAYVTFYTFGIQDLQSKACFDLFEPAEVAGYQPVYQAPEYNRLWISAKSLPSRYQIVDEHLYGPAHLLIDAMAFVNDPANISDYAGPDPIGTPGPHPGPKIASHLVNELLDYLVPETVDTARFEYFRDEILLDSLTDINWAFEWDNYLATGDDTSVKPQIIKLIRAILQSPEFQIG